MLLSRLSAYVTILLLNCASIALAASPTSFCKCICFSNSTIIPLNPPTTDHSTNPSSLFTRDTDNDRQHRAGNCNDCNRKFCLDYNLPICKGAKEEDVFTTCFQRDSRKDEAVVFIFIGATASLLLWAIAKPWFDRWMQVARERQSYLPVSGGGGGEGS